MNNKILSADSLMLINNCLSDSKYKILEKKRIVLDYIDKNESEAITKAIENIDLELDCIEEAKKEVYKLFMEQFPEDQRKRLGIK